MLGSRYAMWIGWGPELTFFYNDAYGPTLGTKHPWALGKPSREVWREIWNDIGPRIEEVVTTGRATYDQDLPLILHRSGYPEETFHTFSYSPLPDDEGGIGGHLCVVIEDTERFIGERRLRVLHEIGARIPNRQTIASLCSAVGECLAGNRRDMPFTLIYLVESDGEHAVLACSTGIDANHRAAPEVLQLDAGGWPIRQARAESKAVIVEDLAARFGDLPTGGWDIPPHRAMVVPIAEQAQNQPAGVMIIGLNPYRPLDSAYRGFIDLLAGQIAAGLADVRAYEREKRRAEALAEIDRAKTAFFSNASHEFRTPLTLMLSPLEDLLLRSTRTGMVSVDREQIELVRRNGLRLLKLVNTLLDFSRLEAGRLQVKPFSSRELLARVRTNIDLAGERRRVARILQDSEQRLRSIFAEANVGIAQLDLSGRYVLVNRKYCEIVGRSMQELLGMRLIELTYSDDVGRFNELLDRMFEAGRPFTIEVRKVRPDGSIIWIANSVSLLDGPDGRPQYVVLIVQDINDRRVAEDNLRRLNETLEQRVAAEIQERMQAEEAFRQAQKMEIIGQLTGGVAHDFNNLLQVIMGNLDALRRRVSRSDFPAGQELLRLADAAARGGQRAATLTQRLLAFARKQPLRPEPLDVNRLASGMSELLRTTVGDNIEIEMLLAANLWRVSADHNQLESAILNLAVNARDAMPDGGKITIETANRYLDGEYSAQNDELLPGQYVMITVTDIGIGMSKEVIERAFDPFFTTKEIGQGTGLGLSQVYGFVKQSGGHVKIYSEEQQGTTVRLYLPRLIVAETGEADCPPPHRIVARDRQ